jgi:D-sedoheptulose 7-phosphate isomerase
MTANLYNKHLLHLKSHLARLHAMLDRLPLKDVERFIDLLIAANAEGRTIFVFGNGGSAATASHFARDLVKSSISPGVSQFRVVVLNDNLPLIIARADDVAYEEVFAEHLNAAVRPGDVVIAISRDGNSEKVLLTIRLANERGATTVGMCGLDGGQLKNVVDLSVHVPHFNMEQVEDAHLILERMICAILRAELRAQAVVQAEGG